MVTYAYSTMLYVGLPPLKALERIVSVKKLAAELSYDNFLNFGGKAVEDRYMYEVLDKVKSVPEFVNSIKVVHLPYDEMEPQIALSEHGIKRYKKWIDFAYRIGAEIAVVHTLKIDKEYENALELNAEFLRLFLVEMRDKGIVLAVENRLEKNLFGSKPSDLTKLVEEVGDEIGICLDLGHAHINRNVEDFLALGKHIVAIHAHDNDGYRDQHKPPYSGSIEWKLIEDWITRIRFKGVVVFEVTCRDSIGICDKIVDQIRATPIANL